MTSVVPKRSRSCILQQGNSSPRLFASGEKVCVEASCPSAPQLARVHAPPSTPTCH